jgi:hypothetical protein
MRAARRDLRLAAAPDRRDERNETAHRSNELPSHA